MKQHYSPIERDLFHISLEVEHGQVVDLRRIFRVTYAILIRILRLEIE
jgi:hypothetical protein